MTGSRRGFLAKFFWTAGSFVLSSGLRFGLNVVLSYLLAPSIMGIMVVVNSVRLGIDLLTDVGIEQNIIHHPDGLEPRFRDTAWTMQVVRGLFLSTVFACSTPFLSRLYHIDVRIFLVAALAPAIAGAHSTAVFVLVKNLEVWRRALFELTYEGLSFLVTIGLAFWLRSVWAPLVGLVIAVAIRSALSFLLPEARQRFWLDPAIVRRIAHFGKWIALTTLVTYAASYFDRLYLGPIVPLALLGIYGIARAIAELPTSLARRMSYQIIFPALAGSTAENRDERIAHMAGSRLLFTLGACLALTLAGGVADWLIRLIYDPRYISAGWMLSVLLMGGVFAVLSNLNEALLLSAGRPQYSSIANVLRLATLAIGLTTGYALIGFPGAVIAVALTEVLQCVYIGIGLLRVRLGFWRQDALTIAASLGLFVAVLVLRHAFGLGDPFAGMWGKVG